ncbi:hypothetical protein BJ138DRAFT_1007374 [Hygrophoropsis aurantiaca]|uniref:Uncharacterized protein n=1 Tax=Hygrophoropsis aurantiaca TaxID=72124 RepID=A0ACB8ACN6_9AGAM|nr:hypothetical protein BJ138DRAFT_1007374 [Hygrophoropsis aurantiaca]
MAYPYPLPFPDESQRTPVSSYSSLANALGPSPSYSIYLDHAPVASNYPYPARNVVHPAQYVPRRPLTLSNVHQQPQSTASAETNDHTYHRSRPNIPMNYRRLPQPTHIQPKGYNSYLEGVQYPSIYFQRKGEAQPYTISELLGMKRMPCLSGSEDEVFAGVNERQIKVRIAWPGYSQYPFEKRVMTKHGELTRELLLVLLARVLDEFVKKLKAENAIVERGHEDWTLQELTHGRKGVSVKDCFIVGLSHLAGCIWQPELFVYRG